MTRAGSLPLQLLVNFCSSRYFDPEEVLFAEGQLPRGLYVVASGKAAVSKHTYSEWLQIRPEVEAGAVLGLADLMGGRPHTLTARMRERGRVVLVPADAVQTIVLARLDRMLEGMRGDLAAKVQLASLLSEMIAMVVLPAEAKFREAAQSPGKTARVLGRIKGAGAGPYIVRPE